MDRHSAKRFAMTRDSAPLNPPDLASPSTTPATCTTTSACAPSTAPPICWWCHPAQEAFGQTASEAHACGTPVVAFRTGGLPDIVVHQRTGYLAQPFEPHDLAAGIHWVLADPARRQALGHAARQRAMQVWNPARVAGLYAEVYRQAMEA